MNVWDMTAQVPKFGDSLTSCICVTTKVKMTQEREKEGCFIYD